MSGYKCRLWDKKNMVMDGPFHFRLGGDDPIPLPEKYAESNMSGKNILIFMQLTGFKDKHGKDIYQSDFVTVTNWCTSKYLVISNLSHHGLFHIPHGYLAHSLAEFRPQSLEVIGNLYEHPHLMEKCDECEEFRSIINKARGGAA